MPPVRVVLLHNPDSGDAQPDAETIRSAIERAGHDVFYSTLTGEWKQALEHECDLVTVAGGDGAVATVFAELATRPLPATIVPVGSANNIATALGLVNRTIEELVDGWATAPRSRYDLGEPGGFAESVGFGLFATLLGRGSEGPSGEDKVVHGLKVLHRILDGTAAEPVRLALDGADRSGDFLAVEVMLIGSTGPNVVLAPLADPSDGLFDVVFVGEEDRAELARYLDDRLASRATRPPHLRVERARDVVIDSGGRPLRIDDQLLETSAAPAQVSTGRLWVDLVIPPA